jgi:dihydrofolate synthase/folylpolyglutamate synthase
LTHDSRQSTPIASFQEALAFLDKGIDYEKTRTWKYDRKWLNLARVEQLLQAIGNPHLRLRVIHVAGTKGKGTTAGAAANCMTRCGRRAALLTSPHLVTPCERVRVDGRMISEADFTRIVGTLQPYVELKRREEANLEHKAPTYFEMMTALAFKHFEEQAVDWAVVEVGLGGRLDSTNVVRPQCCVVTAIGLEHTDKLGDTVEAIAGEKAGIFKQGVPVVLGVQHYPAVLETLRRAADEQGCPRWEVGRELRIVHSRHLSAPADDPQAPVGRRFTLATPSHTYEDLSTPLLGAHQVENLAAAVGAVELAARQAGEELDPAHIGAAVAEFSVPGRLELLSRSPALVLDVAHTVESVRAVLVAVAEHFPRRSLHVVFGCSQGKNLEGMLRELKGRCVSFVSTQANLPRAIPAADVEEAARKCEVAPAAAIGTVVDPWQALQDVLSRAAPEDVVCVTGSFYTAGQIRARWRELDPDLLE